MSIEPIMEHLVDGVRIRYYPGWAGSTLEAQILRMEAQSQVVQLMRMTKAQPGGFAWFEAATPVASDVVAAYSMHLRRAIRQRGLRTLAS